MTDRMGHGLRLSWNSPKYTPTYSSTYNLTYSSTYNSTYTSTQSSINFDFYIKTLIGTRDGIYTEPSPCCWRNSQVLVEHSMRRLASINRQTRGNRSDTPMNAPPPPPAPVSLLAIVQPNPYIAPPETPQPSGPVNTNTAPTTDQPYPDTTTPEPSQPSAHPNLEGASGTCSPKTGGKRKNSDDGNPDSGKKAETEEEQMVATIDPYRAYRDRISQLAPTVQGQVQSPELFLTIDVLVEAIAAVTEAIADNGGPTFTLLSRATPSPMEEVLLARPTQEIIIPVSQGQSHHALVIVRRNEDSDGFYYEFYNSSPSRRNDQVWMQQTASDTSSSLRDMGWALSTNVPNTYRVAPVQVNHDPSWDNRPGEAPRVRENVDDSWVCGIHVVLSGWIYALGLQPLQWPEGNIRGGCYDDALQLVALARDGVVGADIIRDFLACHDLIDRASQVPENRRFTNTHAFHDGHDLSRRVQQVRQDDADAQARQQREETERQEREQSERHRQQELLQQQQQAARDPCRELAQGLAHWRNQQQLLAAEFIPSIVGEMLGQDQAFQAIASVSEAINRSARNPLFSLVDHMMTSTTPDLQTVARPRLEVLYAVFRGEGGFGHLALYIVRVDRGSATTSANSGGTGNRFRVECHDSSLVMRATVTAADFAQPRTALEQGSWTRRNTGLYREAAELDLITGGITTPNVAAQSGGWSCGYYTVMNAWAYALGLQTTAAPMRNILEFQVRAVEMVNLALQGFMDAATIEAFFLCYNFVAAGEQVVLARRFENTVPFRTYGDLQNEVARVRLTEELLERRLFEIVTGSEDDIPIPSFGEAEIAMHTAGNHPGDWTTSTPDDFLVVYRQALVMNGTSGNPDVNGPTDGPQGQPGPPSGGASTPTNPNTQSTNPNTQSTNANTPSPQAPTGDGPSSGRPMPSGVSGTTAPLQQSVIDDITAAQAMQDHLDRNSGSGDDDPNAGQTSPISPVNSIPSNVNGSPQQSSPNFPVQSSPSDSCRVDTGIQQTPDSPLPVYPPPGILFSAAPASCTAPPGRPAWMPPALGREETIRSLQEQVNRLRNATRLNTVAVPREGEHAGQGPERFIAAMTRFRQQGYVPRTEEWAAREGNERVARERQENERRAEEERRLANVGQRPENNDSSNPQSGGLVLPHQDDHNEDDTDSLFGEPRGDNDQDEEP